MRLVPHRYAIPPSEGSRSLDPPPYPDTPSDRCRIRIRGHYAVENELGVTRTTMPSLEALYAKFGVTAEAGQLLETALGNLLISDAIELHGFDKVQNKVLAKKILEEIDRKTLGQLIHAFRKRRSVPIEFETELELALSERNRLNHSFFLEHNLRKLSEEGRQQMISDLEVIHERILNAYRSTSRIANIEISADTLAKAKAGHLPLKARK